MIPGHRPEAVSWWPRPLTPRRHVRTVSAAFAEVAMFATLERRLTIGFVFALASFVSLSHYLLQFTSQPGDFGGWFTHVRAVKAASDTLSMSLAQAAEYERAYLVT